MKRILYLLPLLFWMCSPSDTPTKTDGFDFQLVASKSNVTIDEMFTVTIDANMSMTSLDISLDNFATEFGSTENFGKSKTLYFSFDTLGQKTITIRAKNNTTSGDVVKTIVINVTRGNAIKITGLKVLNFYNMNETWDPEYSANDPNRLADVGFAFTKTRLDNYYSQSGFYRKWYSSEIKQNQIDLTWNISSADLYFYLNSPLKFYLYDVDSPPFTQDLMMGAPDGKQLDFSSYMVTKPNTITYSFPDIQLSLVLTVEWP